MTQLRPTFNRRLFKKLSRGEALNLVGKRGAGCSRALREVAAMAAAEGVTVVRVDMNEYKHHYNGFLQEINGQILQLPAGKKTGDLPPAHLLPALPEDQELAELIALRLKSSGRIFLLLDHFDAILDNRDQRLPKSFFDDLNSIRKHDGIALCCVTERPHLQYRYYFEDEKGQLTSRISTCRRKRRSNCWRPSAATRSTRSR